MIVCISIIFHLNLLPLLSFVPPFQLHCLHITQIMWCSAEQERARTLQGEHSAKAKLVSHWRQVSHRIQQEHFCGCTSEMELLRVGSLNGRWIDVSIQHETLQSLSNCNIHRQRGIPTTFAGLELSMDHKRHNPPPFPRVVHNIHPSASYTEGRVLHAFGGVSGWLTLYSRSQWGLHTRSR